MLNYKIMKSKRGSTGPILVCASEEVPYMSEVVYFSWITQMPHIHHIHAHVDNHSWHKVVSYS
jgi:hypothetical protein